MNDQQIKPIDTDLLARIDAFLAATEMGAAEFGRAAVNDTNLVPQLRIGRELRRATRDKIISFIADKIEQRTAALNAASPARRAS